MTPAGYARPALAMGEFCDEAGEVIPYGRRWWGAPYDGSPPEWAYSTCPHPERFAPVSTVAQAIIDFLASAYDVDVVTFDDVDPAEPDEALPQQVRSHLRERARWATLRARVTVLTPPDPGAAPLAFLFTKAEDRFPGLFVFADKSLKHNGVGCGCDACDDDIERLADDLEQFVFAVVEGHAFERIRGAGVERGYEIPGVAGAWSTSPRSQAAWSSRRGVKAAVKARGSEEFRAWVSP